MSITDQIIAVESGGDPNAQNPYSSASGLGQFTNQTWLNTLRAHRPDLLQRYSPQELLAMKDDPGLARELTGDLVQDNTSYLRSHGLDATPGNLYLAHFAGAGGAAKILGADDTDPVSSVLSQDAITANPFLRNMTVADLKNWASRKMGGGNVTQPAAAAQQPSSMMAMQSQPASTGGLPTIESALSGSSPSAPASGAPASGMPSNAFAALGAVPGLISQFQQQDAQSAIKAPPINFPVPPGLVRARMLARAMALSPATYGDQG